MTAALANILKKVDNVLEVPNVKHGQHKPNVTEMAITWKLQKYSLQRQQEPRINRQSQGGCEDMAILNSNSRAFRFDFYLF